MAATTTGGNTEKLLSWSCFIDSFVTTIVQFNEYLSSSEVNRV